MERHGNRTHTTMQNLSALSNFHLITFPPTLNLRTLHTTISMTSSTRCFLERCIDLLHIVASGFQRNFFVSLTHSISLKFTRAVSCVATARQFLIVRCSFSSKLENYVCSHICLYVCLSFTWKF